MTEVKVPDIGDFDDVPVVAVLVAVGDTVEKEDPLIELESDKATMEVPSSHAGKVTEIKVSEGDKVSEGSVILVLEGADGDGGGRGGRLRRPGLR
ncbi:biotin/lipoyl-containing protein [Palleronia rufa]|uniref:biotin/lipoyl-containing protein n=1 Tax=Palleronia rufa TaxID=1530186 RepID=UPI0039F120E5